MRRTTIATTIARLGATALLLLVIPATAAVAAPNPGWAPGGDPAKPSSQVTADANAIASDRAGECGANSLLLYRVRGSGQIAGRGGTAPSADSLGNWTSAAGWAATRAGWRVRDMASSYG